MIIKQMLYQYRQVVVVLAAILYLFCFCAVFWLWYAQVETRLESAVASRTKQIGSLKTSLSKASRSINIPKKQAFLKSDFAQPTDVTEKLRHLLEGKNNLTLLTLTQKPAEKKGLTKIFKQVVNASGVSAVSVYHFDLKILTNYRAFLDLIHTLKDSRQIFWQKLSYTVSQYPEAVVDIQFYVLSKG